jgi:hypothetical protein
VDGLVDSRKEEAMPGKTEEPPGRDDASMTYLFLRIGMIGAVVLLAASIAIEWSKAPGGCVQTSVSAYYYTPVRAIFVGSMFAVGLALIVYRGRRPWEDFFLNVAGMLAPVVAVAPTTDVGRCWSVPPGPPPVEADGSLAGWVVTNIDNNFDALLIAGVIGFIVSLGLAVLATRAADQPIRGSIGRTVDLATRLSLAATVVILIAGWWLSRHWSDFDTKAHGYSAVLMFAFLIAAMIARALPEGGRPRVRRLYAVPVVLMIVGGALIVGTRLFGEHTVFALEAWEIFWFAWYWIAQTLENWHEIVDRVRAAVPEPSDSRGS